VCPWMEFYAREAARAGGETDKRAAYVQRHPLVHLNLKRSTIGTIFAHECNDIDNDQKCRGIRIDIGNRCGRYCEIEVAVASHGAGGRRWWRFRLRWSLGAAGGGCCGPGVATGRGHISLVAINAVWTICARTSKLKKTTRRGGGSFRKGFLCLFLSKNMALCCFDFLCAPFLSV
jgi:hypothetical protein